ncbi:MULTISPECIES: putative RNA methyltransferase [Terrabacteria group]|uniref:putative RNA methyltransferase n=1 Tax=Bacillati TaxID=1783272 RepID=UPI00193A3F6B|nr:MULTISPECIES: methyltransferase domain-containing protein [Terrabacteria group]MBW9212021.1 methyltransferase domain-containing protein [Trueperella sp. zg.1013]QRG87172.1 methyltransferase domain-containing protein [Bulleidia sp. zg-1006]
MKLLCPICQKVLSHQGKDWFCENNHHFDEAKEGYLHVLPGQRKDHGDEKAMVKARTAFLEKDYYSFLRDYLVHLTEKFPHQSLADFGCGEGYYTGAFIADEKIGIDAAKVAIKHAAKKDKSTQYLVASFFQNLLEDKSQDIVITCFAPIAKEQIERILKPKGIFVVVSPAKKHLWQLKEILYDIPYENSLKDLDLNLKLIQDETMEERMNLNQEELQVLFQMTPYYHHTAIEGRKRLSQQKKLVVLASFQIRIYQKD